VDSLLTTEEVQHHEVNEEEEMKMEDVGSEKL
jgi:hypothetical protein